MFVETNPAPIKDVLAAARPDQLGLRAAAAGRRRRRRGSPRIERPARRGRADARRAARSPGRRSRQDGPMTPPRRDRRQPDGAVGRAVGDAPLHRRRARRQRRRRRDRRHRPGHARARTPRSPRAVRPTSTAPSPAARRAFDERLGRDAARQRSEIRCGDRRRDRSPRADEISALRGVRHRPAGHAGARARPRGRPRTSATSPTSARRCTRTPSDQGPARLRDPPPARRRRPDHAVERAVHARHVEARAVPRRRLHGRAQAGRARAAVGQPPARDHGGGRGSGRACSTSSTASARRPARRSSPIPTCR